MARISKPNDFTVTVEGVGTFIFGRRVMRDEIDIQREYASILGGVLPTPWLEVVGNWLSVLKVLTVTAPGGWDLETIDPLDPATYAKLNAVYDALREKELSFRSGPGTGSEASGQAAA